MSNLVVQPLRVEQRLRQMSLTSDILRQAIRAGMLERASCTRFDPVSTPGYEAWRWMIRTLRELLVPKGWRDLDDTGLPLVVEPELRLAITVSTGESGVGDPERTPTTKYSKGPATERYIRLNREQLLLFGEDPRHVVRTPTRKERITWLLLVETEGSVSQAELSLPAAVNETGYVVAWHERILIGPVSLDEDFTKAPVEPEAEFDVPVARRDEDG